MTFSPGDLVRLGSRTNSSIYVWVSPVPSDLRRDVIEAGDYVFVIGRDDECNFVRVITCNGIGWISLSMIERLVNEKRAYLK